LISNKVKIDVFLGFLLMEAASSRRKKRDRSLDKTDLAMLEMLRKNARISLAEMSRKLGLSKPAVKYRLDRMVKAQIIKSFFTLVDSKVYHITVSVVFDLTVEPQMIGAVAKELVALPEVVRAYELSNSPQMHVHALFTGNEAMEQFLRLKLYRMQGIREIKTGIIMKRYKADLTVTI
jgi:Lrp/AsnC family transcriptional regulator, leucine-responsive regulatory protein